MKKEKIKIEYVFDKGSKNSLWPRLATSSGLAEWFADKVEDKDEIFTFYWDDYPSEAKLLGINPYVYVRFHWVEEDPNTFFEFRIHEDELTGAWVLEITDFTEPKEKDQAITLWDTQVKQLRRKLGI